MVWLRTSTVAGACLPFSAVEQSRSTAAGCVTERVRENRLRYPSFNFTKMSERSTCRPLGPRKFHICLQTVGLTADNNPVVRKLWRPECYCIICKQVLDWPDVGKDFYLSLSLFFIAFGSKFTALLTREKI